MATIKINVMSILAVLAIIFGAIALGLYEADRAATEEDAPRSLDEGELNMYEAGTEEDAPRSLDEGELNMYEAGICIGILISLIVLIVTVCDKPDSLTGKTFLMFALAAILLLAGVICMIVVEAQGENHGRKADAEIGGLRIASYVLAGAELLILVIGAIAPFIC